MLVKEFNQQFPNNYVIHDKRVKNKWASMTQVQGWRVERDGLVPIALTPIWYEPIIKFRDNYAERAIIHSLGFITDSKLRNDLLSTLKTLLSSSGTKRIGALYDLMLGIFSSGNRRHEIYNTLRFLTNGYGYKDNPFLLIAFAHTTVYKPTKPSVGSAQTDYLQIFKAVSAVNKKLYNPSLKGIGAVSNEDAAEVNFLASKLYEVPNFQEASIRRLWISRYLNTSDEEKHRFEVGTIIQYVNPHIDSQSNRWHRLQELDRTRGKSEKNSTPNIPNMPKTDHKAEKYFQKKSDEAKLIDALKRRKKEKTARKNTRKYARKHKKKNRGKTYKPKFSPSTLRISPYKNINRASRAGGGILTLINEVLRLAAIAKSSREIAKQRSDEVIYKQKRIHLQRLVNQEIYREIPPKPATIRKWIIRIRAYGNGVESIHEKKRITEVLVKANYILEESYAFWGNK